MASKDVSIDIVAQDKTGAAFRSVKGGLSDMSSSVGMVTGKIAGLTSVLAAIGGAAQIKGLIDSADNMVKLSQKTGIAVSDLSSLANTADLAGVSNEQLGSSLIKLNRSIAEAASGSKEQSEAFKNLGVSVKDANGNIRPTADILGDVAGAFSGAADGATKTQYAMALFGKSGADLIPFLNTGKQGIKEFGASFGDDFAKNAEAFNDNLTKINQQLKLILVDGINPLLPALSKMIAEFQAGTKHSASFLEAIVNLGTINPFNTTAENLKSVREELEKNNNLIEIYKEKNADTFSLDQTNKRLKARLEYLKEIQREEMFAKPREGEVSGADRRLLGLDKRAAKPLPALGGEKAKKEDNELEKSLLKIRDSYLSVIDQVTKLTDGEDALKVAQFARLGATDEQIKAYETYLVLIRNITEADKEKLENDLKQQKYDEQITKDAKDQADAIKKIFEDTRTPLENYISQIQNLQMVLGKGLIDPDTFSRSVGLASEELKKFTDKGKSDLELLMDAINGFGNEFTSTLTEAFMTGKLNFTDMVNSIQRDILRMLIKKNISDPAVSFLGDFFKGFGTRALGGPVSSNTPYMVGERGPELFVPNGSGSIVPNNKLGGGGVTVVQNINIDSRTDRSSIMAAMNQAKEQAKAEIYRSMKSGGAFA
jgi:TP901 family phage tail tape measure protein